MHINNSISFLIIFSILIVSNTYGQCIETVTSFGNNTSIPDYNITGDVSVTLNTDNTISLNLGSNFETIQGPDVRAYLIKSNGLANNEFLGLNTPNPTLKLSDFSPIAFGITSASGEQSYTVDIPLNTVIQDYDKVLFYCLQYSQFWDAGSFSSFTQDSCSILSIEDSIIESFSIYPNPANNIITITSQHNEKAQIQIHDVLGKKVFEQQTKLNEDLNISNLKSGIYILSVSIDNKTTSKKLIIK